ncbi:hypothetical protein P4S77_11545, partial [Anoxybacillus ayderensis]|nr:hypothetical protein [Anoxybacillus ayderensis]
FKTFDNTAWTAGEMLLKDEQIKKWMAFSQDSQSLVFLIVVTASILLAGYVKNKKIDKQKIA